MAGRGGPTFKKRQKEQQRKERQQQKIEKRMERKKQPLADSSELSTDSQAQTPGDEAFKP